MDRKTNFEAFFEVLDEIAAIAALVAPDRAGGIKAKVDALKAGASLEVAKGVGFGEWLFKYHGNAPGTPESRGETGAGDETPPASGTPESRGETGAGDETPPAPGTPESRGETGAGDETPPAS